MAQRLALPKFGNWENEENFPYTAYYEKERKGRTGGKMNQNDSKGIPGIVNTKPPVQASSFQLDSTRSCRGQVVQSKHHLSQGENDLRISNDSPPHNDDVGRRGTSAKVSSTKHNYRSDSYQRRPIDAPMQHDTGGNGLPLYDFAGVRSVDTTKRAMQLRAASNSSMEQSPQHMHNQAKAGVKGNGVVYSLSWEKNGPSEGTRSQVHVTPGRSRMRSHTRGHDTLDQSSAVPKFGDWDETNPASADGYTHIFNKVREQRQGKEAKVPVQPIQTSLSDRQRQYGNENSKKNCCCLPWGRR